MRKTLLAAACAAILPFAAPTDAQAGDYCREYQRNIVVGNHIETGYGKACLRPDGQWEIVSTSPGFDPYEILPADLQPVTRTQVVYYEPTPQRVVVVPSYNYYRPYYRPRGSSFFFNFGGDDHRHGWNGRRDWDRDHDRNGRGHHH